MKSQKRLGKLEIDSSPPNEAILQIEAEIRSFREAKRRRKAEAQAKTSPDVKGKTAPEKPSKQTEEAS